MMLFAPPMILYPPPGAGQKACATARAACSPCHEAVRRLSERGWDPSHGWSRSCCVARRGTNIMKQETGSRPPRGGAMAAWDGSRDYIRVMLQDLETEARVGLHAWEQHPERLTRLIVNVEMFAHTKGKLGGSAHGNIIDYDPIRAALKQWPLRPHTSLLETLVEEIVQMCFDISVVEACRVSIVKPDIFNEAAGAGVEVYRLRPTNNGTE